MAIIGNKPQIVDAVAGENLVAREYVFVAHPDAPYTYIDGIVPGRVYKTTKLKRHCSINAELCGFVVAAANAGVAVQVRTGGNMSGFTGLVAGATYQPADTAGTIEQLENHRAALPNPVATAFSTTELCVMPQKWGVGGRGYASTGIYNPIHIMSTDELSIGGLLTVNRAEPAGMASALKLFACGGVGPVDTVESLPFSTEIYSDIGNTLDARYRYACSSSTIKGYLGGGNLTSNVIQAEVFTSEGNTVDTADLTVGRQQAGAASSALHYYVFCGYAAANVGTIDKMLFSTEANTTTPGDMPSTRRVVAGTASCLAAFVSGGYGASAAVNTIEKMVFSTDSTSTLAATTPVASYGPYSFSSAVAFKVGGGVTTATRCSIPFSTETSSTLTNLANAVSSTACGAS
jgi:hypothetical protein